MSDVGDGYEKAATSVPPRVKRFEQHKSPSADEAWRAQERDGATMRDLEPERQRERRITRNYISSQPQIVIEVSRERSALRPSPGSARRERRRSVYMGSDSAVDRSADPSASRLIPIDPDSDKVSTASKNSSLMLGAQDGSPSRKHRSETAPDSQSDAALSLAASSTAIDQKPSDPIEEKRPTLPVPDISDSLPPEQADQSTEPEGEKQETSVLALATESSQGSVQIKTGGPQGNTETPDGEEGGREGVTSNVMGKAAPDDEHLLTGDDKIFRTPSRKTTWNEKAIKRSKPIPPSENIVDHFGGLQSPGAVHASVNPFSNEDVFGKTEGKEVKDSVPGIQEDITKRLTCSLNLVCYSRGCSMVQIRVATRTKFEDEEAFKQAQRGIPGLITTDHMLFEALRRAYRMDMCGFWRRWFSLKTLRRLRLPSYANNDRPLSVPWDEYTMQEVLAAFNDPSEFGNDTDWIEWVFSLRQRDKRHMLEFVEGWNATRIAILGSIPCLASTLVGLIWSVRGGDIQTAFTVAGFILTVATVLLALLAIISGIDSRSY